MSVFDMDIFLYMEIHFPYNLKFSHLYSNFSVLDRSSERIFVSGNKRSDTEVINEMPVITCAHMLSYMKDYFYIEQLLYGNQQSIKQHYLKTS